MAQAGTAFAQTTDHKTQTGRYLDRTLLLAVTVLIAPLTALTIGGWLIAFYRYRISWRIPLITALALIPITALTRIGPLEAATTRIMLIAGAAGAFGTKEGPTNYLLTHIWSWIFTSSIFMITAGTWIGATIICWAWVRRPKWEHRTITPRWFENRALVHNMRAIGAGIESPTDGITVGVCLDTRDQRFAGGPPPVKYGRRVVLTGAEISGHTAIFGSTGSGKTTTMLVGIRDVIRQGHGCVFLDCKGGPDVPIQLAEWAQRYGRTFHHWTIHEPGTYNGPAAGGGSYYDPINRGDASRRKDLLIGSQKWDVEFYKGVVEEYLQTAFQLGDIVWPADTAARPLLDRWKVATQEGAPAGSSFERVMQLLDPEQMKDAAAWLRATGTTMAGIDMEQFTNQLDRTAPAAGSLEYSGVRHMRARLHTLTASTAGSWLRTVPGGAPHINLLDVAHNGEVVCFSLDTSNYQDTAALVAGLIIQDLKTLSSELRHQTAQLDPLHVYVDEFSAVDSTNILGLLAKARDAKMPVTLATQALADLARDEATFVDQVLGILGSFIIHRANQEADARIFAGLTGLTTRTVTRQSLVMNTGFGVGLGVAAATGAATLNQEQGYWVEPQVFQNLKEGHAVVVSKIGAISHLAPVRVIRENQLWAPRMHDPQIDPPTWGKWVDTETRRTWPCLPSAPTQLPGEPETVKTPTRPQRGEKTSGEVPLEDVLRAAGAQT